MFEINILSISVWVLGALLILIAIIVILWRLLSKNKDFDQKTSNIGSISKKFNDFIIAQSHIHDFDVLYNVLIKNKYAPEKFSLIPALIFAHQHLFISTDMINLKPGQEIIINKQLNHLLLKTKTKDQEIKNVNLKQVKNIKKYLQHEFPHISFLTITPTLNNYQCTHEPHHLTHLIPIIDFEKTLLDLSKTFDPISKHEQEEIIKKLTSKNLFKIKNIAAHNALRLQRYF